MLDARTYSSNVLNKGLHHPNATDACKPERTQDVAIARLVELRVEDPECGAFADDYHRMPVVCISRLDSILVGRDDEGNAAYACREVRPELGNSLAGSIVGSLST